MCTTSGSTRSKLSESERPGTRLVLPRWCREADQFVANTAASKPWKSSAHAPHAARCATTPGNRSSPMAPQRVQTRDGAFEVCPET